MSRLRDLSEEVLDEVGAAALPGAAGKDGGDGRLQTGMGIGDRELDAVQAAGDQRAQEAEPGRAVLAREDLHAEDLPVSGLVDAGGHDDGDVHGPSALAALHFEGIEPEVGVGGFQGPLAESLHGLIEFTGDLGDARLGDPRQPEGLHQALHPAGRDAEDVRLGDNREERPFRPAPRLQEPLREVGPLPKPRDSQGHLAHPGFQRAYPIAVAGVDAFLGTLAVLGTAEGIGLVDAANVRTAGWPRGLVPGRAGRRRCGRAGGCGAGQLCGLPRSATAASPGRGKAGRRRGGRTRTGWRRGCPGRSRATGTTSCSGPRAVWLRGTCRSLRLWMRWCVPNSPTSPSGRSPAPSTAPTAASMREPPVGNAPPRRARPRVGSLDLIPVHGRAR